MENNIKKLDILDVKVLQTLNNSYYTVDSLASTLKMSKIKIKIALGKLIDYGFIKKIEQKNKLGNKCETLYYFNGNIDISNYLSEEVKEEYLLSIVMNNIKNLSKYGVLYTTTVKLKKSKLPLVNKILLKAQKEINELEEPDAKDEYQFIGFFDSTT